MTHRHDIKLHFPTPSRDYAATQKIHLIHIDTTEKPWYDVCEVSQPPTKVS